MQSQLRQKNIRNQLKRRYDLNSTSIPNQKYVKSYYLMIYINIIATISFSYKFQEDMDKSEKIKNALLYKQQLHLQMQHRRMKEQNEKDFKFYSNM